MGVKTFTYFSHVACSENWCRVWQIFHICTLWKLSLRFCICCCTCPFPYFTLSTPLQPGHFYIWMGFCIFLTSIYRHYILKLTVICNIMFIFFIKRTCRPSKNRFVLFLGYFFLNTVYLSYLLEDFFSCWQYMEYGLHCTFESIYSVLCDTSGDD